MFEKVGKQFQTFARVAGRWEQENGFMVGKAVFGAQVGSFSGLWKEAFRICGGGGRLGFFQGERRTVRPVRAASYGNAP